MRRQPINRREFEQLLLSEFPELRDEVKELKDLYHLKMMEFVLFTERACRRGDWETVRKCLRLADKLLRDGNSEIKNAVYVSYLESLPRGRVHERLLNMMSRDLRKGWDDIMDYLSKVART